MQTYGQVFGSGEWFADVPGPWSTNGYACMQPPSCMWCFVLLGCRRNLIVVFATLRPSPIHTLLLGHTMCWLISISHTGEELRILLF